MMSGNAWSPAANATTGATGGLGGMYDHSLGGAGSNGAASAYGGLGGSLGQSIFGSGYQPGSIFNILMGLFGNASSPYNDASKILGQYGNQAIGFQLPFLQAGQGAIGDYQKWLQGMSNPSQFINSQMNQYQQSPWAQYEQNQAIRSGQNAATASGLSGSTPFAQQLQQNATNISSGDMQRWLGNVLGVNNQYGAGLNSMMGMGANSANALSNLLAELGGAQAGLGFGADYANQQGWGSLFKGLSGLFGL